MLKKMNEKYEVALMGVSVLLIVAVVAVISAMPDQTVWVGNKVMFFLTHTFGSMMQVITAVILVFLIVLALSKYGSIRLGNSRPKYRRISWVAMMFFTGLGAGTVYWAVLEWGYHFNAAPAFSGVPISEAYNYELSLSYVMLDWGPSSWALYCVFVLPFAYHYYVKESDELRFSALCRYTADYRWLELLVNFIFIFAAVGAICITAGTSASTIASAVADLLGISPSYALMLLVLLGTALLYSISSFAGIQRGMKKMSDINIYLCALLAGFILLAGNTGFIIDSISNSLGLLAAEFPRMVLWADPVAKSGYPQDWTAFYMVYCLVFGPFTGLFVAKISEGRTIREIVVNMLVTGSAGLFLFMGILTAYGQDLRIQGILDIPEMISAGKTEAVAAAVIETLPFSKIVMIIYLVVMVLFLATTLDATSFTLSATISRTLRKDEEPKRGLKGAWCILLVAIPAGISYIGTDLNTIKAIVLATGLPLVLILILIYSGFLRELKKDYGKKSREEIIDMGKLDK